MKQSFCIIIWRLLRFARKGPPDPNACALSLLSSMRLPCTSFRRKTESSLFKSLLDPGSRRGDDRTRDLVLNSPVLPPDPLYQELFICCLVMLIFHDQGNQPIY